MKRTEHDYKRIGFEQEIAYYTERGNYDLALDFLKLKKKIQEGSHTARDTVILEIVRLEMEQRGER